MAKSLYQYYVSQGYYEFPKTKSKIQKPEISSYFYAAMAFIHVLFNCMLLRYEDRVVFRMSDDV